jgi:hypothetical protein
MFMVETFDPDLSQFHMAVSSTPPIALRFNYFIPVLIGVHLYRSRKINKAKKEEHRRLTEIVDD